MNSRELKEANELKKQAEDDAESAAEAQVAAMEVAEAVQLELQTEKADAEKRVEKAEAELEDVVKNWFTICYFPSWKIYSVLMTLSYLTLWSRRQ